MKLGCCINMLAGEGDTLGQRFLPELKAAGYDYAELPLAQVMELSGAEQEQLQRALEKNGLPCECCNNFYPSYVRLTGEHTDAEQIRTYTARAVETAARLGARVIVFGSSGAKNVPEGFSAEKAFEQIADTLELADREAGRYGIRIAVEPLNRKESNIILNLAEGARLTQARPYRHIGLLVDYYHHRMEAESDGALRQYGDRLLHVHFAEPEGRRFPSEPREEYKQFFQLLKACGYGGRVSIEAFSEHPREDIGRGTMLKAWM